MKITDLSHYSKWENWLNTFCPTVHCATLKDFDALEVRSECHSLYFFLFWIVSVVELWNVNAGRINAMF